MRFVLLLLTLMSTGCFGDHIVDSLVYGPDRGLMVALYAYREGAGHWPASPAELEKSQFLKVDLHLGRYKNLNFDALGDGRLAVTFDSYISPDSTVTWSKCRLEIGESAAH